MEEFLRLPSFQNEFLSGGVKQVVKEHAAPEHQEGHLAGSVDQCGREEGGHSRTPELQTPEV